MLSDLREHVSLYKVILSSDKMECIYTYIRNP